MMTSLQKYNSLYFSDQSQYCHMRETGRQRYTGTDCQRTVILTLSSWPCCASIFIAPLSTFFVSWLAEPLPPFGHSLGALCVPTVTDRLFDMGACVYIISHTHAFWSST